MTRQVHSIKYMQAIYRKFQILALACALLTVTAAILATFSGSRAHTLRMAQTDIEAASMSASADELAAAKQALQKAQSQLSAERDRTNDLTEKIIELERRLDAARSVLDTQVMETRHP